MTTTPDFPEPSNTVTLSTSGMQITLDLHQMLTAIDPEGRWLGYDPDTDEGLDEPTSLAIQIADLAADRLVKVMRREVTTMIENRVGEQISGQIEALVREHIEGTTVQQTDEFGFPKGTPAKPLTQMIVEAATKGLNTAESYGRGPTKMQKMVDEAVGRAFKTELAEAVKVAKQQALAAVQDSAAQVIRETIERSARGL